MSKIWQDLRYAFRVLGKAPGSTAISVLLIAVGVAATTVILSVANALLFRPLPVDDPSTLVRVQEVQAPRGPGMEETHRRVFSFPRYAGLRDAAGDFLELAAVGMERVSLRAGERVEAIYGLYASDNYFRVLGLSPARGRFFGAAPGAEPGTGGAEPVVVISHHLWQSWFDGDPGVVGRPITVNGQPLTVAGVAPAGFSGTTVGLAYDLWLPLEIFPQLNPGTDIHTPGRQSWLELEGRLAPGVSAEQAATRLASAVDALGPEVASAPATTGVRVDALNGVPAEFRGGVLGFTLLLQVTALLVLLIASANVAGVLLARASARRREIAVRLAIGAGRGRLIRQLVTESVVLFLLGGGAGLILAAWGTELLALYRPPGILRVGLDIGLSPGIAGIALLVAFVTGIGCGLAPALQASRPALVPALKEGTTGGDRRRSRLRGAFVVGQLATSLVLLTTAGLFVRSLQETLASDPGFDFDGVVTAELDPSLNGYTEERGRALYADLLERVRNLPGVESATLAAAFPARLSFQWTHVEVPERDTGSGGRDAHVEQNVVDTGYFETLRIPLLAGRDFQATDRAGAPAVAIVNEVMARDYWPGEGAVGKELRVAGRVVEVVGVVGASRSRNILDDELRPYLYLPFAQAYHSEMALLARAPRAEAQTLAALRRELRGLDPDLPLQTAERLETVIGIELLPQRLASVVIGAFGVIGLVLAAFGIYGVLAFQVGQRTPEIGIRLALGARVGEVVGLVLRQGIAMIGAGVGLGLVLAYIAARLVSGFLHGVGAGDALTFVGVPLVLAMVALLASWIPARRAARVDPMVALRAE